MATVEPQIHPVNEDDYVGPKQVVVASHPLTPSQYDLSLNELVMLYPAPVIQRD